MKKPSACRLTLCRCKFWVDVSCLSPWSTCRATKTFVADWRTLLRKVEPGSTLFNKVWLCYSFSIKLATCHATNLLSWCCAASWGFFCISYFATFKPEIVFISLYTPSWRDVWCKRRHTVKSVFKRFFFLGRGLTIVGSILEGDFNERADDVALAKEVILKW